MIPIRTVEGIDVWINPRSVNAIEGPARSDNPRWTVHLKGKLRYRIDEAEMARLSRHPLWP